VLSGSVDTVIYMYYGNAAVSTPTENPTGVWDSDFVAVWHMSEDPADNGTPIEDSTWRQNDGVAVNTDITDDRDGLMAGGIRFDQGDEELNTTAGDLDIASDQTVEMWGRMDAVGSGYQRIYNRGGSSLRTFSIWVDDDSENFGRTGVRINYDTAGTSLHCEGVISPFTYGEWRHFAITFDDTADLITVYIDGAVLTTCDYYDTIDTGVPGSSHHVGNLDSDGVTPRNFNGVIDEFRVSTRARSEEWLRTSWRNQLTPGAFYAFGLQQLP